MPVISTDINDVIVHRVILVIREYIMFNDLSRIFVTLWFRHQETTAPAQRHWPGAAPLPVPILPTLAQQLQKHGPSLETSHIDSETGLHVCGFKGCQESFEREHQLTQHQQNTGIRAVQAHAALLFVYLPHYLVFKTDIVISVHVSGAQMFLRM
jgi:hypothetical protein